jgi:hypothetical protein
VVKPEWDAIREPPRQGHPTKIAPFQATSIPGVTPAELLQIAREYYRNVCPADKIFGAPRAAAGPDRCGKLKIGYVSSEFREPWLLVDVLERHDRSSVEVIGLSTLASEVGPTRDRVVRAFDEFIEI